MTRRVILGMAGVLVASGLAVAGPQIKFTNTNAWGGSSSGGPFEVQAIGFTPIGLGLNGATQPDRFLTFCVEMDEHIRNGRTYDVEINTAAVNGGAGGPSPDPLGQETAFLYTMFMNGTLSTLESGFTYLDAASGIALQDAIWELEEEIAATAQSTLAGKLVALANSTVDSGSWSGIGNVRIMNLTYQGGMAQDQLVMIPLPSAAGLAFVGFGVLGTRRRR